MATFIRQHGSVSYDRYKVIGVSGRMICRVTIAQVGEFGQAGGIPVGLGMLDSVGAILGRWRHSAGNERRYGQAKIGAYFIAQTGSFINRNNIE
jgi:hypothetical protein